MAEGITVEVLTKRGDTTAWIAMRAQLWPDTSAQDHAREAETMLLDPAKNGVALAMQNAQAVGFIELSVRTDYVNGCDTSPVAFVEGLWTAPAARHAGVGRALMDYALAWARTRKLTELASDTPLANTESQQAHLAMGFEETERVVYYRKIVPRD
ncbi:MAG: aminoglycoside 6'-N-acetyltransferase [Burkholderiaceae bacterium]